MSFIEKVYPKVVMARKKIIVIASVALLILVMVIFIEIYRSSHNKTQPVATSTSKKAAVATEHPDWYQNQEVRKPNVPTKTAAVQNLPKPASAATAVNGAVEVVAVKTEGQATQATSEEMKKILGASIASNQINDTSVTSSTPTKVTSASPAANSANGESQRATDDQNLQGEKKTFLKVNGIKDEDYLQEGLKNPFSPYEVKAATVIPATLITGINSDLPGQIIAQVRSNVYDTIAGKYILIPQGAKLTGLYDSQIAYGQSRVLVVWKRIIYPNGQSINLEGMPGIDMSGYAGADDLVNNHYMKIFGSVILMSIISAGAQLSQPQNSNNSNTNPTINQTLAASLGTNIMNSANMMMQKNLGIQPTLVIRPGYLLNVSVTKDIVFPGAYQEGTTYAN